MILVDSSAWIEYYKKGGDEIIKEQCINAIQSDLVAINGIVQVEILGFESKEKVFETVRSDFSAYHFLDLTINVFQQSYILGKELRQIGINIPATDLIIAGCALFYDVSLLHLDKHFSLIAKHYPLESITGNETRME
ncbi:MAG: PIN domain-containing protein [Spirochaetota bacterium]